MNRKQLTLLIIAGAIIGGLGYYFYQNNNNAWEGGDQKPGRKVIKDFPMNDVERVSIKQSQGQLTLAKKDEKWVVEERGAYPANFSTISDLLRKVWELKVAQAPKVSSAQLSRLELLPPDKGTNSGTLVEFKDKSGKSLHSLLLGKKHMKSGGQDDSPMGGGGWPDGRYLMVGNDTKTVAVVSDALANVEAKPEEWLNKDFFKVENLKSIAVTSATASNNWRLAKPTQTNDWVLADAKPGEQPDNSKFVSATSALSAPSFNDVATNSSPEAMGLKSPLVAKLETFEGFTYEIKVGSKASPDKDDYYFQVAINGDFPKERAPGKDEKPEDKAKLDKEFQERTKKLEEKLKAEKAFEKWTFMVSKYTIEPLLKERKEFMVEKKEEPKTAEAPALNPTDIPSLKPTITPSPKAPKP